MAQVTSVRPMDPAKHNSRILKRVAGHDTVVMSAAQRVCYWNDREFAEGSEVCTGGNIYECSFGSWVKQ